jgi:NAD(P)-dependent dehydrogenase (short-subunit alcohol dehydrogenase family)
MSTSPQAADAGAPARAVVITGASSGIGRATALELGRRRFQVFAGVRKPADGEHLAREGGASITPVTIDVTDGGSIQEAAAKVSSALGDRDLAGLVNNAGIAISGPLEFLPVEELRHQLEVNLIGQVAVTQAFQPLLRRARGRIVNTGSIGGRVAVPFLGPYAASKFAMEGLSDAISPDAVAAVVAHALTAQRPKTRYVVGRTAKAMALLSRFLPDRAFDAVVARAMS